MEIIHLVMGKANPNRMNGVNKVVHELASRQAAAGCAVQVWGFTNELSSNYPDRNFQTVLFQQSPFPFGLTPDFVKALKHLDTTTIFHLHGGWIPLFFIVTRALRKAGLKYVITGHGAYNTVAMKRSKWRKRLYFQLFEKQLLKNAAAIHCIGKSEVTGLQNIFPTDRTMLIPYGIDVTLSPPPAPKADTSKRFVFGFVGRLDAHTKGLDLLLSSFAYYFRGHASAVLWLIGDGQDRSAITARAEELGISKKVILWGARYGAEKDQLIQQMDVFLHPSRNEGLPNAVLEASALGVPSIVTEATNIGQYLTDHGAGLVVANEDAIALGKAMVYCSSIRVSRLQSMGYNAMRMVTESFNWSRIVLQFNKLYA